MSYIVIVGEVHFGSDHSDVKLVMNPALPEAGVEKRSFVSGMMFM